MYTDDRWDYIKTLIANEECMFNEQRDYMEAELKRRKKYTKEKPVKLNNEIAKELRKKKRKSRNRSHSHKKRKKE